MLSFIKMILSLCQRTFKCLAEVHPREKCQAQGDGGGVQGVGRAFEFDAEAFMLIQELIHARETKEFYSMGSIPFYSMKKCGEKFRFTYGLILWYNEPF